MNDYEKKHIKTLRSLGCSFGQIAEVLTISENTIRSYCRRNDIQVKPDIDHVDHTKIHYRVCPECHKLFVAKSKRKNQFCSASCRAKAWRKKQKLQQLLESNKTLQSPLDSSAIKSDEWDAVEVSLRKKE